jgi:hypothetical protein
VLATCQDGFTTSLALWKPFHPLGKIFIFFGGLAGLVEHPRGVRGHLVWRSTVKQIFWGKKIFGHRVYGKIFSTGYEILERGYWKFSVRGPGEKIFGDRVYGSNFSTGYEIFERGVLKIFSAWTGRKNFWR